ncbi:MAG: ShlB/FhaC/HecB family hemolysin secretion/activation protein [Magnetococcales bacterium]|nr:ShlB/FhaC/HecB family hemolysin secretion/activation protein [Magnetococcales bacterium]NGZ26585.1 ShlB/FhaC/HecB family hemolysin secretion/activation protein [Magnetococcales bacterium]
MFLPHPAQNPQLSQPGDSSPLLAPESEVSPAPLASQARFMVRRFRFSGHTVFSEQELQEVAKPYQNREITSPELQQLRRALSLYYVERGYLTSGALIPDQVAKNGIIHIQLVEGRLAEIRFQGLQGLDREQLEKRLQPFTTPPIQLNRLQEGLLLLRQSPLVERINAELVPGEKAGEGVLLVKIEERSPLRLRYEVANNRPAAVGEFHQGVLLAHDNVFGRGESIELALGKSQGAENWGIHYRQPLTADDLMVDFTLEGIDAEVVEEPFSALNITGRSAGWTAGLSLPIWRDSRQSVSMGMDFRHRESRTTLLGEPFSLSPGAVDGKSVGSTVNLFQEWLYRTVDQVVFQRLNLQQGVDWLGATSHDNQPDSRFQALQLQAQLAQQLPVESLQLQVRFNGQWSEDRLLTMHKFALGGLESIRGIRENHGVVDSGWLLSSELRWSLGKGEISLGPFIDYGGGGDHDNKGAISHASTGLALHLLNHHHVQGSLYWGVPIQNSPQRPMERGWQDRGIHFRLAVGWF